MVVTDQYAPMVGGVPTVTRELAQGLGERGHAVTVVAPTPARQDEAGPSGTDRPDPTASRPPGQAPVTVDLFRSVRWPWYEGQRLGLLSPARATALIRGFAPDVVHVHSPLTLGAAAVASARRRRVPVVYTNHYLPLNARPGAASARPGEDGAGGDGAGGRLFEAAFYAYVTGFANRCDHVTTPTATALRLLREHGLRVPSEAVSNGVDLATFSPGPADAALRARYGLPERVPLILSVGRLSPEKRADVLIAALARLPAGDGSEAGDAAGAAGDTAGAAGGAVLALAGAGPDEERLRRLARHHGVSDRIRFLGFVPEADLPGLYRLADVFAIASQAELQSLVTMAAMASGLPVVAVNAGALGELVHPGENGLLARPGNAGEVAACLGLLCADPGLRARMSKASVRIIGDHDRHRMLSRWESIYRALAWRVTAEEKNG
jgi:glycosyltransferase involved in cell wall biosynthesis